MFDGLLSADGWNKGCCRLVFWEGISFRYSFRCHTVDVLGKECKHSNILSVKHCQYNVSESGVILVSQMISSWIPHTNNKVHIVKSYCRQWKAIKMFDGLQCCSLSHQLTSLGCRQTARRSTDKLWWMAGERLHDILLGTKLAPIMPCWSLTGT